MGWNGVNFNTEIVEATEPIRTAFIDSVSKDFANVMSTDTFMEISSSLLTQQGYFDYSQLVSVIVLAGMGYKFTRETSKYICKNRTQMKKYQEKILGENITKDNGNFFIDYGFVHPKFGKNHPANSRTHNDVLKGLFNPLISRISRYNKPEKSIDNLFPKDPKIITKFSRVLSKYILTSNSCTYKPSVLCIGGPLTSDISRAFSLIAEPESLIAEPERSKWNEINNAPFRYVPYLDLDSKKEIIFQILEGEPHFTYNYTIFDIKEKITLKEQLKEKLLRLGDIKGKEFKKYNLCKDILKNRGLLNKEKVKVTIGDMKKRVNFDDLNILKYDYTILTRMPNLLENGNSKDYFVYLDQGLHGTGTQYFGQLIQDSKKMKDLFETHLKDLNSHYYQIILKNEIDYGRPPIKIFGQKLNTNVFDKPTRTYPINNFGKPVVVIGEKITIDEYDQIINSYPEYTKEVRKIWEKSSMKNSCNYSAY